MLADLQTWYAQFTPKGPQQNIIGAGLILAGRLREGFPLKPKDYLSKGRAELKGMKGETINLILHRHGEHRQFGTEAGRTSRGTVPKAEELVARWNGRACFASLSPTEREAVIQALEGWLIERAADYFNRKRIAVDYDPRACADHLVAGLLAQAQPRGGGVTGAVAQHLVGAALALRWGDDAVPNHKATTADAASGRPGDYELGDVAIHVTVRMTSGLLAKLKGTATRGLRSLVLVRADALRGASELIEAEGLATTTAARAIEHFVGQALEESARYERARLAPVFLRLLETYNARVAAVEVDRSRLLDIPTALQGAARRAQRKPDEAREGIDA